MGVAADVIAAHSCVVVHDVAGIDPTIRLCCRATVQLQACGFPESRAHMWFLANQSESLASRIDMAVRIRVGPLQAGAQGILNDDHDGHGIVEVGDLTVHDGEIRQDDIRVDVPQRGNSVEIEFSVAFTGNGRVSASVGMIPLSRTMLQKAASRAGRV